MKRWRMRTTLMIALLAVSFGLTATCLLIIRMNVQQQIRASLASDLAHSVVTFRNLEGQRNHMLAREAALMADLPSLKALMATQDTRTIQDGSLEFWRVSGSDFFALADADGSLQTYSSSGQPAPSALVNERLRECFRDSSGPHVIAVGDLLYDVSVQPVYFGSEASGSQIGFVAIGYGIDQAVAREVSEAAAAEVAFLSERRVAVTTLKADREPALFAGDSELQKVSGVAQWVRLGGEEYMATSVPLSTSNGESVQLVVLKSYDQASLFLKRVNRWIVALGAATLLIGLLLALTISRTVTRPLEALVAGTRALGRGDFTYRFRAEGAEEVRELTHAFEFMRGELQGTQERLLESERLATIGRMASSVSHDLRHHLSAIYANAEFLSLERTTSAERQELLGEVQDGVHGMTEMIESLLLFSQTGQALNLQETSLGPLLERTADQVRPHPDARDVEIVVEAQEAAMAWVDDRKLGRAIYNLLLNGCQAARRAGTPSVVRVSLIQDSDVVSIDICDSGGGVPAAIRQTLFDPFVSVGKQNGTGLGLTLAQHIAQEHGGSVVLEETSPGRTVFRLNLSRAIPKTDDCEDGNQGTVLAIPAVQTLVPATETIAREDSADV